MNLFGLKIVRTDKNGKYVKKEECHRAQDSICDRFNQRISDLDTALDRRFDDLKNLLSGKG